MSGDQWDATRPWSRQPFDTDLGWHLFSDYLILPLPRKFGKLAEVMPKHALERLARDCFWSERAALWDEHLSDIRTTTIERVTEETAAEVAKRQLALTRTMQRVSARELRALEKAGEAGGDMPGLVNTRDAIRLAAYGIRLERLIMGEATDRTEVGPDLAAFSIEELRALRGMQVKAGVR